MPAVVIFWYSLVPNTFGIHIDVSRHDSPYAYLSYTYLYRIGHRVKLECFLKAIFWVQVCLRVVQAHLRSEW